MRRRLPSCIVALGCALLTGAPAQAAAASSEPTQLIVRFQEGVGERGAERIVESAGGHLDRDLKLEGATTVLARPDGGESLSQLAARLEDRADVAYAEPDVTVRAAAMPNDPLIGQVWSVANLGATILGVLGLADADADVKEAWDVTTGSPGVVVAVADGGVSLGHPDLAPNIWRNPGETGGGRESNARDDDRNGYVDDWRGWDFVDRDNDPDDKDGHGSHVAGALAARGNNGVGVAGVSWSSQIMPLRFLGVNGIGRASHAAEAIRYAAGRGVRIINLSFMAEEPSQTMADAIASAPDTLVVAAAGNQSRNLDADAGYPCSSPAPNLICVGATNGRDEVASFSNWGRSVHLGAPGEAIFSPSLSSYSYFQGTSMAVPHVAGAAALAWTHAPGASLSHVRDAILGGVDRPRGLGSRFSSGGRLNVRRTLELLRPSGVPPAADVPASGGSATGQGQAGAARPVSLAGPSRQSLRSVRSRGLSVTCTGSAGTRCAVRVLVTPGVSQRLRLGFGRKTTIIGRRTVRVPSAGRARFRVDLWDRATRSIARLSPRARARISLVVEAQLGAGARTGQRVRLR